MQFEDRKRLFSALSTFGCLSAIALGFISPKYALAYSFASLLFFYGGDRAFTVG